MRMPVDLKKFKYMLFCSSGAGIIFLLTLVLRFSTEDWIVYEASCIAPGNNTQAYTQGRFESDIGPAQYELKAGGGGGSKPDKPRVVSNTTMTYHFDLYRYRVEGCCANLSGSREQCYKDCEAEVNYSTSYFEACNDLGRLGIFTVITAFLVLLFGLISLLMTITRVRLIHLKDIFFPVRGVFWALAGLLSLIVWLIWLETGEKNAEDYLSYCDFPGSFKRKESFTTSQNSIALIISFSYAFFMTVLNQCIITKPSKPKKLPLEEPMMSPVQYKGDDQSDKEDIENGKIETVDGELAEIVDGVYFDKGG